MTLPTAHPRDRDLVDRILGGEPQLFERLISELEPDLRRFLRGLIHTRPELVLEDVLQDVRIYLYQRLDRYNADYPLIAFAKGLARNVARRHVFKKSDLEPRDLFEDEQDEASDDLSPQELSHLPGAFRQVLGEGRFEPPDGPPPPSRVFLEMFEAFLCYGGYPHQQVAFGFSILLWGQAKDERGTRTESSKVPVTGDPDRVARELGPRQLDDSAGELLEDLTTALHVDPAYVARTRKPLDARLDMKGQELFARDKASALQFAKLLDIRVGLTQLREYFGKDPRKSVADWTHGVKERIKKAVTDPKAASRSLLPAVPPTPREPSPVSGNQGRQADSIKKGSR